MHPPRAPTEVVAVAWMAAHLGQGVVAQAWPVLAPMVLLALRPAVAARAVLAARTAQLEARVEPLVAGLVASSQEWWRTVWAALAAAGSCELLLASLLLVSATDCTAQLQIGTLTYPCSPVEAVTSTYSGEGSLLTTCLLACLLAVHARHPATNRWGTDRAYPSTNTADQGTTQPTPAPIGGPPSSTPPSPSPSDPPNPPGTPAPPPEGGNGTTGDILYTTPGTYTWVAPANVTSVSIACIGGGGGAGTYVYGGSGQPVGAAGGGGETLLQRQHTSQHAWPLGCSEKTPEGMCVSFR
jgi:hypothetical protein